MSDLKSLTAAQVKKLPCGAKVVIKGKQKDKACELVQYGRHKKLLYQDKWTGVQQYISITEDKEYMRL